MAAGSGGHISYGNLDRSSRRLGKLASALAPARKHQPDWRAAAVRQRRYAAGH